MSLSALPSLPVSLRKICFSAFALACFAAGPLSGSTGPFEVIATLKQNPTTDSRAVVVHPGGRFYYQASSLGVAVMASRDDGSWHMAQMLAHRDDGPDLRGLDLEMGPEGRYLYLLSGEIRSGRTLVTLAVDQESGEIEPVQTLEGDLGSSLDVELETAVTISVSPEGDRLLVATLDREVWILSIDAAGRLSFLRLHDFSDDVQWQVPLAEHGLRFDAANGRLYVVSRRQLASFSWHAGTGELPRLGSPISQEELLPGENASALLDFQLSADGRTAFVTFEQFFYPRIARLTLGDDGRWLAGPGTELILENVSFVAAPEREIVWVRGRRDDDSGDNLLRVWVLTVDAEGGLERVKTLISRDRDCCFGAPQRMALSPDGQKLLVPNFESRGASWLDVPSAAETVLSPLQESIGGLRDVRDLLISADGRFVYTASYGENGISLFERVEDELVWRADFLGRELGIESMRRAVRLYLSPDERFLYLRGDHRSSSPRLSWLSVFARDRATGMLSFVDDYFLDGETFDFSPDGRHGYLAGRLTFRVYDRGEEAGLLTEIPEAASSESAEYLRFEPQGDSLYAITSVAAERFRRDAASGFAALSDELDFNELARAFRLEVSDDGRFIYFLTSTSTSGSGRITVVERELSLDSHSVIQVVSPPQAALPWPSRFFYDFDLEANGERAFYAGDRGVGWVDRDPSTGLLSPRSGFERDRGSRAAVVRTSPGGGELYAYYPDLGELEILSPVCQPELGACLGDGRFQLEVEWRDPAGNEGRGASVAVGPATEDSTVMWFFTPGNWEFLVKVLDGCGFNQHYWVFASAATNVEYTLTVTEIATGKKARYFHELGDSAPAITDTEALAVCP